MNKIYGSKYYTNKFLNKSLKQTIKKLLISEVLNKHYSEQYDDFLIKNYKIKLIDLCKKVADSLLVSSNKKNYIIYLNNNIYINNNKLETIVNLVDYGSTDIRGCRLFSNIFKFVDKNIDYLFDIYGIME